MSSSNHGAEFRAGLHRHHFAAAELDYALPEELIAQTPPVERTDARLLHVERGGGRLTDRTIRDMTTLIQPGDALVLNNTRVLPAKFQLQRSSGGRVDGMFLEVDACGVWNVLLRGAQRLRQGEVLHFCGDTARRPVIAEHRGDRGAWRLRVEGAAAPADLLRMVGRMPLPPYIKRERDTDLRDEVDVDRYQTVYAERDGAVAAPTAGLHFSDTLLQQVAARGAVIVHVTLHVGYGTFAPLEVADLADHKMHAEHAEIRAEVARKLLEARSAGGRVIAVGTTSARVLESAWIANRWQGGYAARTNLFCYPPFAFGGVDALMTNFHLPRSTLLALVMAFAGVDLTRQAYAHAIAQRYRFYSYGDAMLID